jgi:hypothetical protein
MSARGQDQHANSEIVAVRDDHFVGVLCGRARKIRAL